MNNLTAIVIEHGVPMPERRMRPGEVATVLKIMNVGDSVVVHQNRRVVWKNNAKMLGISITTKRFNKTQIRIWRTA